MFPFLVMQHNESNIVWGSSFDLFFVVVAVVSAGFLAKLPDYFGIVEENYFARNAGFIALLPLITFFDWKKKLPLSNGLIVIAIIATAALVDFCL